MKKALLVSTILILSLGAFAPRSAGQTAGAPITIEYYYKIVPGA